MKKQNNIIKKLVVMLLTSVVLMSSLTIGLNTLTVEAATNEVSMYSATTTYVDSVLGMSIYKLNAGIKVKNLSPEKKVVLHWRDSASNDWRDMEAKYSKTIDGEYEVWTATPAFHGEYIEYAIRYEVNGQVYWDNNNGKNYKTYKYGNN